MNALKSYFRPSIEPKAIALNPVIDGRASPRGAPIVGTLSPQAVNLSINPPGTPRYSGSRPVSAHPDGDFRNNAPQDIDEIKSAVAISWVYQLQNENMWNSHSGAEGVVLRKAPRQFVACPDDLMFSRGGLFDAASELNARVSWAHRTSYPFSR
jgi:hypothetical protein